MIEELNRLPKYPDASCPFGRRPLRILYDAPHRIWWLQDAEKGHAGYGWWYTSLRELMRRWEIVITGYDTTTRIFTAVPDPQPMTDERCFALHFPRRSPQKQQRQGA